MFLRMEITALVLLLQLNAYVFSQNTMFTGSERNRPIENSKTDINILVGQKDTGSLLPPIDPAIQTNPTPLPESLPVCINIVCTLEYIPEECRDTPIRVVNGVQCRGCPTWAEKCKKNSQNLPSPVPDTSPPPEVSCPILNCPLVVIPPGCEYIETYEYLGRKCEKCPVWRSGCTENSGQIECPFQSCTYIPPQCKEVSTYTFRGRKCEGCPIKKRNCNSDLLGSDNINEPIAAPVFPEIACPLLICNERIPVDCQVRNTYTINGKICDDCPTWNDKCKPPAENIIHGEGPRTACPLYECPGNIPDQCVEHQPYDFQGQTCFKCPKWLLGCVPSTQVDVPRKSCPLMRCEPLNIPLECIEDTFFDFEGMQCQGCPAVKSNCKPFVNSQAGDILGRALTENENISVIDRCPPQKCPFIYIPPGCEDREAFMHEGKVCYRCPRRRHDCGEEAIRCPPVPCPFIYIPPECEEKQPYLYQGRICYKCPKHKEGCIPTGSVESKTVNEISDRISDPSCPPVGCPLILIPEECREEQPFQLEGRTCYGCPKWREGCAPGNSNQIESDLNNIVCPLFGCPRVYIPKECLEEQPYNFQGKVCYMCPKWREECVPKNGIAATNSGATNKGTADQSFANQDLNVIAIDPAVPTDKIECPLFKCPRIRIPEECVDKQPFDFNGKTCFKCPRWRPGCVPGNNITNPVRGCPALVNCPSAEIPSECREETTYVFDGQTCNGCPKFRDGCIPLQRSTSFDVTCPLLACARVYIPLECREEHPYDFQGKTCYNCPTLKKPCIPDEAGGMLPGVECPLLDCPDVRIPEECREVKTYNYESRLCEKCPSWKLGCTPSVPVRITEKETVTTGSPPSVVDTHDGSYLVCPVPKCPRIRIPEECKFVQSYQFQGKTCYKCPLWKPGCLPNYSVLNDKTKTADTSDPLYITPQRLLIDANMAAISCPKLPCQKVRIPVHCQEPTIYNYMGKTCIGCPTWSSRCDGSAEARNINMNGLLSLSLFNELMLRR